MTPATDPFDLRTHLVRNHRRIERILARLESGRSTEPGIDRVKIEAVAEIRQNMALAHRAIETLVQAQAAQQFEQIVIDVLGQQSPRVRKQLIGKLNETRNNWRPSPETGPRPANSPTRPRQSKIANPKTKIRARPSPGRIDRPR